MSGGGVGAGATGTPGSPEAPGATGGPRVAVVIINFRQPEMTLDAVASVEADATGGDPAVGPPGSVRVVVVDNDSGDGSADVIERALAERGWTEWARLVRSPKNGGFSWGNNVGIEAEPDADAYLLLNGDAMLRPGALARLLAGLDEASDVGLVGPQLEWPDGRPQVCCFRDLSIATEFSRAAATGIVDRVLRFAIVARGILTEPVDTDWVSFACVLVRRAVVDDIGLMDDGYFMYFEDIDYARRARAAGWRVRHDPRARAIHLRGGSSETKAAIAARKAPPGYYYESRSRYFGRFYGGAFGVAVANLVWLAGRPIGWLRERLDGRPRAGEGERRLLWTRWRTPMAPPSWPKG